MAVEVSAGHRGTPTHVEESLVEKEKERLAENGEMLKRKEKELEAERALIESERNNLESERKKMLEEKVAIELERREMLEMEDRKNEETLKHDEKSQEAMIKNSHEYLCLKKEKTELETKLNEVEKQSFEDKTKLCGRVRQLQKAVADATAAKEKEESRQMSVRRQEKEFRERALEELGSKDLRIEDLEAEVLRLKKVAEEGKATTSNQLKRFPEVGDAEACKDLECLRENDEAKPMTSSISPVKCVLCSKESLFPVSSFIFHIARDHMFDQYRVAGMPSEGEQVARFLKLLEEKAKKKVETKVHLLEKSLLEAQERLDSGRAGISSMESFASINLERVKLQKETKELRTIVKEQKCKIMLLEGEQLALISRKESLEKQFSGESIKIAELEAALQNQDALRGEVEELKKRDAHLGEQLNRKCKEAKDETRRRRAWRDKYEAKKVEVNILKSNSEDLTCDLERLSEVLGQEEDKYVAKKIEANILKAKLEDMTFDLERLSELFDRERRQNKEDLAAVVQKVEGLEERDENLDKVANFVWSEVEDEIYRGDKQGFTDIECKFSVLIDESMLGKNCPVFHHSVESGAGDSEESQMEWECLNQASKRPRLDSTVSSYASEKEERAGDDFPRMAFREVLVVVEANEAVDEIFDLKVASRMKK